MQVMKKNSQIWNLTQQGKKPQQKYRSAVWKAVDAKKVECTPFWIMNKALMEEVEKQWNEEVEQVHEDKVGKTAKVIPSYAVYKVKAAEKDKKLLKARQYPNGNRDRMKKTVRKDTMTAEFDIIRLLLSFLITFFFTRASVDIKGVYPQSGPIKRRIYVGPPLELLFPRHIPWKLLKLPYCSTEPGDNGRNRLKPG